MRQLNRAAVALIAAIFTLAAGDAAQAGVLAHWSFDSDFTDSSGTGNDLTTAAGTPTITSAAGEFVFGGGALDLDSTISNQEHLVLDNQITFGASQAWSVTFWGQRRTNTDDRTGMILGDLTSRDFIWTPADGGGVQGLRFRSSNNTNADYSGITDDNAFHHWAVIGDGAGNVEVYRDNTSLGTVPIATTFDITNVGHAFNATTQSYDGQLDEIYIFDEAIDAATVDSLFRLNELPSSSAAVPEPATATLLLLGGVVGLLLRRQRRRR
jgi:hypothetical protein